MSRTGEVESPPSVSRLPPVASSPVVIPVQGNVSPSTPPHESPDESRSATDVVPRTPEKETPPTPHFVMRRHRLVLDRCLLLHLCRRLPLLLLFLRCRACYTVSGTRAAGAGVAAHE